MIAAVMSSPHAFPAEAVPAAAHCAFAHVIAIHTHPTLLLGERIVWIRIERSERISRPMVVDGGRGVSRRHRQPVTNVWPKDHLNVRGFFGHVYHPTVVMVWTIAERVIAQVI
jgi:hypothetical protein